MHCAAVSGLEEQQSNQLLRRTVPHIIAARRNSMVAEPEGFEPSMQVLPTYSLSRGAPSATRSQLRGRDSSGRASRTRRQDPPRLGRDRPLVEIERLVQGAHGELHVLLVDHDAGLDLARRDHLDVDSLLAEGAEHLARDADVRAHADADDAHLADAVVADQPGGAGLRDDRALHQRHRPRVVVARGR